MPYDEALAERIGRLLKVKHVKHETKRMMGGLTFMVRGKMCVGVEKDRLMARIDPAEYEGALKKTGCKPMDFTGRPMRGFVFVESGALRTDAQLTKWLDLALDYNPRAPQSRRKKTSSR